MKKKVILKPVNLSRGRGIFIVESEKNGLFLTDYSLSVKRRYKASNFEDLYQMLRELGVHEQSYLYQTYIPLLKVSDRSFDVRVVMQKYKNMNWICSGIECRVAKENEELTNISRGGDAMTLEDVIRKSNNHLSYTAVEKNIMKLCQNFCSLINKQNHHFGEFGLDIALDENGYPWILEANIFPSFKGFKQLDYDTYLKIGYQPLFYAVELQGFSILEETEIVSKYKFIGKYNRL
jgi:glutathione synthase/RimK-type ligase-like ATP-grasp enzyme